MFKVGLVGAGAMGFPHANAIAKNENCVLTMVADLVIEKAEEIARLHNATAFTDYRDFCKNEEEKPDVVILNLPHFLHYEATVYFLNKGVNVLVEKPMAMNVEECDKMIEVAKQNGVKLGVGHVMQYMDGNTYIKEAVESGKYGKLVRMTETRNTNYFKNRPAWFLDRNFSGGGITMNYGAHTLNRIFYITGSELVSVNSMLSNFLNDCHIEEGSQFLAEFSDGFSASASYSGGEIPNQYELNFYFTKGIIKIIENDIYFYEGNEWKSYPMCTGDIYERQIENLVLWLKGEENMITTPEHGKKVIAGLEKILSGNVLSDK